MSINELRLNKTDKEGLPSVFPTSYTFKHKTVKINFWEKAGTLEPGKAEWIIGYTQSIFLLSSYPNETEN